VAARPPRWWIAGLAALALVLTPVPASAQDDDEDQPAEEPAAQPSGDSGPRVYIVSVPMSDELEAVAARVGAAARSALRDVEGVNWAGPDQLFLGYDDTVLQQLRSGRQKLAEGRQAYIDLDLDRAITLLQGAVADFDAAAMALEDPTLLGDALLFLGAAQAFANRTRDARRTFGRLHAQMPERTPDPNSFNPDVVALYEASAPRDREAPNASIVIESEPAGAIAYVDFVPRGRTPITVEGLIGGQHVIRVTRPGATPFVQPVDVGRGGSSNVNAFLQDVEATQGLSEALTEIVAADVSGLANGGPIASVATTLELDKIGVIRVSPTETTDTVALELLLFDVGTGRRLLRGAGQVPIAVGDLEPAVGRLVSGGLTAGLSPRQSGDEERIPSRGRPSERDRPVEPADDGEPGIFEKWWFWAAVGGAVLLGVVITVIATSGGDGPPLGQDPAGQLVLEF
jgi:hypothetical protein